MGRAPWCPCHKSSKLNKATADVGESEEYDYTDSEEELDINVGVDQRILEAELVPRVTTEARRETLRWTPTRR
jgi:hypothetical protein